MQQDSKNNSKKKKISSKKTGNRFLNFQKSLLGKKGPSKSFIFISKGNRPNIFVILLFIFVGWILLSTFLVSRVTKSSVPFSQVISQIERGDIERAEFSGTEITAYPKDGSALLTSKVPQNTDFLNYLEVKGLDKQVELEAVEPFNFLDSIGTLFNILFFILLAFLLFNIFRSSRGGGPGDIFSFGKSRAKLFKKGEQPDTTFKDVAVAEEVKEEMYELVDFLKNPQKYRKVGARIPKGVLLVGPAGVGKTLIARAIAGEADVPFYNAAGSEFMEMLVGVGSASVRDMFLTAKKNSPALIFIDEIDAIGRQRGMGIGGGHDEREQTLNQILVEMDGFDKNTDVIVLAASVTGDTNILIKENNETKLLPIGKFIDKYYSDIDKEGEIAVNNIQALSYEKNGTTISSKFTPVKSIFRHKVDRVYEIEYLGGKVKATGNHSVFVWESHQIKSKPVSELETGNVLVGITPQRIENIGREFGQLHLEIDVYNKDIG